MRRVLGVYGGVLQVPPDRHGGIRSRGFEVLKKITQFRLEKFCPAVFQASGVFQSRFSRTHTTAFLWELDKSWHTWGLGSEVQKNPETAYHPD